MKPLSGRIVYAVALCGMALFELPEAGAQTSLGAAPSVAPSPAVQAMQGSFPLFTPTVPNTAGDPTASAGSAAAGSIFSSPMAAPMLYGSMLGMSLPQNQSGSSTGTGAMSPSLAAAQYGMLMMMANQQNGGLGSGQISGSRAVGTQQASSLGTKSPSSPKTRTSNRPGGLAAKYFNRTNVRSNAPKAYFNRRPGYFP